MSKEKPSIHELMDSIRTSITPEVWCAIIPEIFGYGLIVFELSEVEVKKSIKREFFAWRKAYKGEKTYTQAMEYFGGRIFRVEIGKCYNDNLNY